MIVLTFSCIICFWLLVAHMKCKITTIALNKCICYGLLHIFEAICNLYIWIWRCNTHVICKFDKECSPPSHPNQLLFSLDNSNIDWLRHMKLCWIAELDWESASPHIKEKCLQESDLETKFFYHSKYVGVILWFRIQGIFFSYMKVIYTLEFPFMFMQNFP